MLLVVQATEGEWAEEIPLNGEKKARKCVLWVTEFCMHVDIETEWAIEQMTHDTGTTDLL